jgi:hypothetical protein
MLRRTISVKDESTPTMSRLKACQSGAAANRRFSRGEVNVRYGSLADIGEGYQGCPLYPQKRTCSSSASMSDMCH